MKKTGLLLLLTCVSSWFIYQNYQAAPNQQQTELQLPSGGNEENTALRKAWELQRLADPATGRIPEGISFLERQFVAQIPWATSSRSGGDWESRGPWNVGGRTRALAMDVTDENRLLAAGVSGGLWLSEDGGQSWTRRTGVDAHPGSVSIAQDTRPGKTNTWYYIAGEIYGNSASGAFAYFFGDGMYKSTDGGLNWSPIASTTGGNPHSFTTAFQTGWRVITSPTDTADVVYMALYGGIYRSADGGGSWTVVRGTSNLSTGAYFTDIAVTSTGVLYATLSSDGVHKGVWRSTDGVQWTEITPAIFPSTYDRIAIGINPDNENEVYFLGATPGSGHYNNYIGSDDWSSLWKYTYLSGNGSGAAGSWEDRTLNLPDTGTEFDRFASQGGYDLVVRVQPGTGSVFIGGTSLWRSTDGFTSPNNTRLIGGYKPGTTFPFFEIYPTHHPDLHDVLFLPSNPNVMLSASDGGLHRTEDCTAPTVNWTALNNGYQTAQLYTAIIDEKTPGDQRIIAGLQDNGNFYVNSSDPNAIWKQTINGDGGYGFFADDNSFAVLTIQLGRVAKCHIDANGNVTGFRRIDPIGPQESDYLFINPLAKDPSDQNILYHPAGHYLYRQNDLANIALTGAWDTIVQGWTKFPDSTLGQITAIAVSNKNPAHRVYVGTASRRIYRIDNAHTGTPTLQLLGNVSTGTNAYTSSIAVDPDNADRVIITFSNYGQYSIFLSENGGQNWKKVAGNLEISLGGGGAAPSIRWLRILPFPDGSRKYFCGTSAGLFSADTLLEHTVFEPGTQWKMEAPGLIGTSIVDAVSIRPSDGWVVAGTHGTGIYAAQFMPTVGNSSPFRNPVVQVFPNPASQYALFNWQEAPPGPVRLRLFNLQGQLLHSSNWTGNSGRIDLQGFGNGIYLYEIQGEGWKSTGRLVKSR